MIRTFETRGVLAGAYKNGLLDRLLTHYFEIGAGPGARTLCGRIAEDHLSFVVMKDPATCPVCVARFKRLGNFASWAMPYTAGAALAFALFSLGCGPETFIVGEPFRRDASQDAEIDSTSSDGADAELDASTAKDAGQDAPDAGPTCTPVGAGWTWTCSVPMLPPTTIKAPGQYCADWAPQSATPLACRACVETYTCACLIAQGFALCSGGYTWKCSDMGGQLHASCVQL